MTIKELIEKKKRKFSGLERNPVNPNSKDMTFISNPEEIKIEEIKAYKAWLSGNGNKLLNFYTADNFNVSNFLYDRNNKSYFWSISALEWGLKRIHSGIPKACIDTLSNVIGLPKIDCGLKQTIWEDIAEKTEINSKMVQLGRPLTMGVGYGAWKINFDLQEQTLDWEFYDAEDIEYIYNGSTLVGIIFKSYFKDKDKDYLLLETRYADKLGSHIEYNLYQLTKGEHLLEVDEETYQNLIGLDNVCIDAINEMLAVPSRYIIDPSNPKYGVSILSGKLDVADEIDEILSIVAMCNRYSVPIEYVDATLLGKDADGNPNKLNTLVRHFIKKQGLPDGEGNKDTSIQITQPDVYFEKYITLAQTFLDYFLIGFLSPATMGIDIAKKDNAEAQREKEKVTIMTRNNVIDRETWVWKKIVRLSLMVNELITTGTIAEEYKDISVAFDEFANPSFENELTVLGSAWGNGELSTKRFVELLWSDKLSNEEKQEEIEWLDSNRMQENQSIDDIMGAMNEETTEPNVPQSGEIEEEMEERQE